MAHIHNVMNIKRQSLEPPATLQTVNESSTKKKEEKKGQGSASNSSSKNKIDVLTSFKASTTHRPGPKRIKSVVSRQKRPFITANVSNNNSFVTSQITSTHIKCFL